MKHDVFSLAAFTTLVFGQPVLAEPFPPTSPEFVQVEENKLLLGGLPDQPASGVATKAQIESFFGRVQAEKIEHRYLIGSCEDRAHFIAMLARKYNLPVSKVWAIAPARVSLLSRQLIRVKDPLNLVPEVTWGHHVAPVILMSNGTSEPEAMVIDQAISPTAPIRLRDWMAALATPRATYLVTGSNDYLFNSLDGLTVYDNRSDSPSPPSVALPGWIPNILTGDFQKYSSKTDDAIAGDMALDDLALAIFEKRLGVSASDATALREILKTEVAMKNLVSPAGVVPPVSAAGVQSARAFHSSRKIHWQGKLTGLH